MQARQIRPKFPRDYREAVPPRWSDVVVVLGGIRVAQVADGAPRWRASCTCSATTTAEPAPIPCGGRGGSMTSPLSRPAHSRQRMPEPSESIQPVYEPVYEVVKVVRLPVPNEIREPDCMIGPKVWVRRRIRRLTPWLVPRQAPPARCWYHQVDWRQAAEAAMRLVRQAQAAGLPGESSRTLNPTPNGATARGNTVWRPARPGGAADRRATVGAVRPRHRPADPAVDGGSTGLSGASPGPTPCVTGRFVGLASWQHGGTSSVICSTAP
ncbi:hypothetical protein EDD27_3350 [Nonomuraea polychroma]|uniref:Uncharacterized protein n=1 Tax=Nonomuraea polychroma TaxID=46176 RepID=A0A438M614_9ACTN|nr:hypothetical protein EDD27_3350 [Nonomuraea polychroma]